jgi:acetolactate synthase I/II/III large subunit
MSKRKARAERLPLEDSTLTSRSPSRRLPDRASMVVPRGPRPPSDPTPSTGGESTVDALVETLVELGVEQAFAVFGGSIAPFCEALNRSPIRLLHFRHEGGAAFAAIEASLATGKLTVVVSTSGPGMTNSCTGMVAARSEGAHVLFVSGTTSAAQRGRMAFQETGAQANFGPALFAPNLVFHYAAVLEDPAELQVVASRLASGVARRGGFVAHLGLPLSTQTARSLARQRVQLSIVPATSCSPREVEQCARLLAQEPFVIWAGFGAREAALGIRELSVLTGASVMCTPRGKGVVPERDARYLGVTGLGGHPEVLARLAAERPARLLVLGTRLGEMSSFWSKELLPTKQLIHVDLDPDVFGASFPSVPTLGVVAEVGAFVEELIAAWPRIARESGPRLLADTPGVRVTHGDGGRPQPLRSPGPVRPSYLMSRIQRWVVEKSQAPILAEAGNSFSLATHYLSFRDPKRYRVSTQFGSMGQAAAGVLGAALARAGKAFAILGDGAMLMQNEISTAASYAIDAVWIVLNDARYGMIAQGMESIGWQPFETDFPRADFVAIARAMGGDGVRVEEESEVDRALELALAARGPFVVDVIIDPSERAPAIGRNQSLMKQGVNGRSP